MSQHASVPASVVGRGARFKKPVANSPQTKESASHVTKDPTATPNVSKIKSIESEALLGNSLSDESVSRAPKVLPKRSKPSKSAQRKTGDSSAEQTDLEVRNVGICLKSPEELEKETIKELATSAISVGGLLSFLCEIHSGEIMEFVPDETTTAEVVFQAIIPLTARSGSSFAKIVNDGRECYPDVMISHAWGNTFLGLVASVVATAMKQPVYYDLIPVLRTLDNTRGFMSELAEDVFKLNVWLCICGVNQHQSICCCHQVKYLNGDPRCQMDKFHHMLKFLHQHCGKTFQQAVVPGIDGVALTRAWVISEIATCMSLGIRQSVTLRLPVYHRDCNSSLMSRLESLDVRNCNASRLEDKEKILSAIDDKDDYNRRVRLLLQECIDSAGSEAKLATRLVIGFAVGFLGGCVFLGAYLENPLPEKIRNVGPVLLVEGPAIILVFRWWVENDFLTKALRRADRLGLCHEVAQALPTGSICLLPIDWLCRRLARACDGVPLKWKRTGELLMLFPTVCFISLIPLLASDPGEIVLVFVALRLLLWGIVSHAFATHMTFDDEIRAGILPMVGANVIALGAALVLAFYRWIKEKKFVYMLVPKEKIFVYTFCVTALLHMWSHRIYGAFRCCCSAGPFRGLARISRISRCMSVKERVFHAVHTCVHAWSENTVQVENLATDVASHDLKQVFAEIGPLVGVFLTLDSAMRSKGTATVTFSKRDHAMKAVERLDGLELKQFRIQVRPVKHDTLLEVSPSGGEA